MLNFHSVLIFALTAHLQSLDMRIILLIQRLCSTAKFCSANISGSTVAMSLYFISVTCCQHLTLLISCAVKLTKQNEVHTGSVSYIIAYKNVYRMSNE